MGPLFTTVSYLEVPREMSPHPHPPPRTHPRPLLGSCQGWGSWSQPWVPDTCQESWSKPLDSDTRAWDGAEQGDPVPQVPPRERESDFLATCRRGQGTQDVGSVQWTSRSLSRSQLWLCRVPLEPRVVARGQEDGTTQVGLPVSCPHTPGPQPQLPPHAPTSL